MCVWVCGCGCVSGRGCGRIGARKRIDGHFSHFQINYHINRNIVPDNVHSWPSLSI